MGLFATFAIYKCPACGAPVNVAGMVFGDEPAIHTTTCERCRTKLQVRKDPATGRLVIEKLVEQ